MLIPDGLYRGEFIGATDSAVPCTMLLDIAMTLTPYLRRHTNPVSFLLTSDLKKFSS